MEFHHILIYAAIVIGLFILIKPRDEKTKTIKSFSHYEDYVIDEDGVINMIKHVDIRV